MKNPNEFELFKQHAAHYLIFFFFSARSSLLRTCEGLTFVELNQLLLKLGMIAAESYCQRACFEGTKKPIGWVH
jgi:hypothetical protein